MINASLSRPSEYAARCANLNEKSILKASYESRTQGIFFGSLIAAISLSTPPMQDVTKHNYPVIALQPNSRHSSLQREHKRRSRASPFTSQTHQAILKKHSLTCSSFLLILWLQFLGCIRFCYSLSDPRDHINYYFLLHTTGIRFWLHGNIITYI